MWIEVASRRSPIDPDLPRNMRHRRQPQRMTGDELEVCVMLKKRKDELLDLLSGGHQRGFTCVTMIRTVSGKYLLALVARVRVQLFRRGAKPAALSRAGSRAMTGSPRPYGRGNSDPLSAQTKTPPRKGRRSEDVV